MKMFFSYGKSACVRLKCGVGDIEQGKQLCDASYADRFGLSLERPHKIPEIVEKTDHILLQWHNGAT